MNSQLIPAQSAVKQAARRKKPIQFNRGILRGIGGMNHIPHHIDTEVTTNGSLVGLPGIRWP